MSAGAHVWFDLMTTDPDAGRAFYTALIGYGTEEFDTGMGPYHMFTVDGDSIGGVMKLSDQAAEMGAPPHWLGYIGVEDLDASFAKVQAQGGKAMHPPVEIPNVGRFATVADPQGAVFAIFQPQGEMSAKSGEKRFGEVSWVELMTTDHVAGLDFYIECFGWRRTEAMDMGEGWMYQMFGQDNTMGGAMTKKEDMPGPAAWLYYIHVADVNATVAKAKKLGATVVNGPMEVPGGDLVAQICDPQGAMFAVHGPAAAS